VFQIKTRVVADVAISIEAVRVDNDMLLDYLTSKVALEEAQIGSTDPNIPIGNNCMDDEMYLGMPGCSGDYEDEGDEINERDAISAASLRRQAVTELGRFDLGISDVDRYQGKDGDDADVDEKEESSQAND